MIDPDDTLPPSERKTDPAPPMLEELEMPPPVTFFPSVLQTEPAPPPDSGVFALDHESLDDD